MPLNLHGRIFGTHTVRNEARWVVALSKNDLVTDLKQLRRGFGVESLNIAERLGSALRVACGVGNNDGPAALRLKVISTLNRLTGALPGDLCVLGRAALNLSPNTNIRYEERIAKLATDADRHPRTIRRRVDEVMWRLAELMLESPAVKQSKPGATEGHPWHTKDLRVDVQLGRPVVEVLEERTVVCNQEGLDEIDLSVTLTPEPDLHGSTDPTDLGVDVHRGGVALPHRQAASNRFRFGLRPPQPLRLGQEHNFAFRLRVSRAFAPHYVCTPEFPCECFTLAVRFGQAVPSRIWLLNGEFPLELTDPWHDRRLIPVDATGSAHASFTHLTPNRSYGIGWQPLPG
jgi:hypothetical protein